MKIWHLTCTSSTWTEEDDRVVHWRGLHVEEHSVVGCWCIQSYWFMNSIPFDFWCLLRMDTKEVNLEHMEDCFLCKGTRNSWFPPQLNYVSALTNCPKKRSRHNEKILRMDNSILITFWRISFIHGGGKTALLVVTKIGLQSLAALLSTTTSNNNTTR